MMMSKARFFDSLKAFINTLSEIEISDERKKLHEPLIEYISAKVKMDAPVNLLFVCTHNSRRSHLSQIWAQVMANYFDFYRIQCFSGGTEVTRMYASVIDVLENVGFDIQKIVDQDNSVYSIHFALNTAPIVGFSKKYSNPFNPKSDFASIMTCTDADIHCPFVQGSDKRISLPYEDPKVYDGTKIELEKYHERMRQIASEMYYIFSKVNEFVFAQ